jgi:hypothetical protein
VRTLGYIGAALAAVGLLTALGPLGFALLVGLVLSGPVGAVVAASLRVSNERSPTHRVLSATADTAKTPPAGRLHRTANASLVGSYGARMAVACKCDPNDLDRRRKAWGARSETTPTTSTPAGASCGCSR